MKILSSFCYCKEDGFFIWNGEWEPNAQPLLYFYNSMSFEECIKESYDHAVNNNLQPKYLNQEVKDTIERLHPELIF